MNFNFNTINTQNSEMTGYVNQKGLSPEANDSNTLNEMTMFSWDINVPKPMPTPNSFLPSTSINHNFFNFTVDLPKTNFLETSVVKYRPQLEKQLKNQKIMGVVSDPYHHIAITNRGITFTKDKAFTHVISSGIQKEIIESSGATSQGAIDVVYSRMKKNPNHNEQQKKQKIYEMAYEISLWEKVTPKDLKEQNGLAQYLGFHQKDGHPKKLQTINEQANLVFKKYEGTLDSIYSSISDRQPEEIQRIIHSLLQGTKTLQKHTIAHLDLKPDNFLITKGQYGRIQAAQITDLGLSKDISMKNQYPTNVFRSWAAPEYLKLWENNKKGLWTPLTKDAYKYDIYTLGKIFEKMINQDNSSAGEELIQTMTSKNIDERADIDWSLHQFKKLKKEAFVLSSSDAHDNQKKDMMTVNNNIDEYDTSIL